MMEKEELLQKYFLEGLNEAENKAFETALNEDAAFRAQFEFEKELQQTITVKERETLKSKLNRLETEIQQEDQQKPFQWKSWRIAAVIALMVGFAAYFFTITNNPDVEQLYATHYKAYPNTVYTITRGNGESTTERMAFAAYETNQHTKAIRFFQALKKEKSDAYINFYLAQSYLNIGNIEEAIPLFKSQSEGSGQFKKESLWYLALTYLLEKDLKKAKSTLKILIERGDYKKQEAIELLKELS